MKHSFAPNVMTRPEMSGHARPKHALVQSPKKSCIRARVCFGHGLGHELMSEVVSVHLCYIS